MVVACFLLVTCLAYISTLKTKAVFSSEISVNLTRATRRHIPGESSLVQSKYNSNLSQQARKQPVKQLPSQLSNSKKIQNVNPSISSARASHNLLLLVWQGGYEERHFVAEQ
jgi:hypothetical protein